MITQAEFRLLEPYLPPDLNDVDHMLVGSLLVGAKEHLKGGQSISDVAAAARLVARQFVVFRSELGGGHFYVRKGIKAEMAERNRAIVAGFDGRNMNQLALKYGLSAERVRQILDRDRARRRQSLKHGRDLNNHDQEPD